jgi:hypothetical protein
MVRMREVRVCFPFVMKDVRMSGCPGRFCRLFPFVSGLWRFLDVLTWLFD